MFCFDSEPHFTAVIASVERVSIGFWVSLGFVGILIGSAMTYIYLQAFRHMNKPYVPIQKKKPSDASQESTSAQDEPKDSPPADQPES